MGIKAEFTDLLLNVLVHKTAIQNFKHVAVKHD